MRKLWLPVLVLGGTLLAASLASADNGANLSSYTPAQVQQMSSALGVPSTTATLQAVQTTAANLPPLPSSDPTDVTSVEGTAPQTYGGNAAASSQPCWYLNDDSMSDQWGIWPFQQKLIEHRQWCAQYVGGPQTYRASQVHIYETLCGDSNRYTTRVGGGNGSTYTVVETGASFTCPTPIPWISYHYDRWMWWRCNTYGNCWFVKQS